MNLGGSCLSVRLAVLSDLQPLAGLYAQFRDSLQRSSPTEDEFAGRLRRLLTLPEVRVFIAHEEDLPVGYAFLRHLESAWSSGRECLIEDLFVAPTHRGRKIAQTLLITGLADARNRGCTSGYLDTNERNEASNALYRKLGFTTARARWDGGRQVRHDIDLT